MKTCKTCKHSKRTPVLLGWLLDWNWEYAMCQRHDHLTVDLVSGKKLYKLHYCETERKYTSPGVYCGPEGDFWEAK